MRRAFVVLLVVGLGAGQLQMVGALLGRYYAQKEMHGQIEDASASLEREVETEHLTISRSVRQSSGSSFVWVDEQEFRYQGGLYDVVRAEWRGDIWHVWAVHDKQEEHYLDVLAETSEAGSLREATVPTQKLPTVLQPVALLPTDRISLYPALLCTRPFRPFCRIEQQAPYLAVPHPPPWA